MPQLRSFLDRIRPVAVPGAASRVGVAADPARVRAAELGPVLDLLAATHVECERIIAAARVDARHTSDEAQRQLAAIAADAQRQAEAARTAAAEEVLAAARERARTAAAAAEQRVRSAPRATEVQIGELVADAVALIQAGLPGRMP